MNTIRSGFRLLTKNIFSLILFETAYKLLCAAVFAPALIGLFNLSLFLSGYRYLSEGRLFPYLTHPATIVLLLIILFGITLITL